MPPTPPPASERSAVPTALRDGAAAPWPLTYPQRSCLLLEKVFPGTSVNTLGGTVRLRGAVDLDRLETAFQAAVRELDAFRSVFDTEVDPPRQWIRPFEPKRLPRLDFAAQSGAGSAEDRFATWAQSWFEEPLRFAQGELYRCVLFTLGPREMGYAIKVHHAVADGWSMSVMTDFIKRAYESADPRSYGEGSPSFSESVSREADYLASAACERDRRFWQQRLDAMVDALPERRPKVDSAGHRLALALSPQDSQRAHRLCQRFGCSLNVLFVALFALYRAHVHGVDAGVVSIPLANRASRRDRQRFGMLVTHLPLTYRLRPDETFAQAVARLSTDFRTCCRHRRLPSPWMQPSAAGTRRFELFDFSVNHYRFDHDPRLGKLRQRIDELYSGHQPFALQLVVREWAQERSISLCYDYLDAVFDATRTRSMHEGLTTLLAQLDASADAPLGSLQVVPRPALLHRRGRLVGRRVDTPAAETFTDLFLHRVAERPSAPALLEGEGRLSYDQLSRRSAAFASRLRAAGLQPGYRVGLLAGRSTDTVVALLGILRMGGVLVPLAEERPQANLAAMCRQAAVRGVVHDAAHAKPAARLAGLRLAVGAGGEDLDAAPPVHLAGENLAYVIFTSGSTGLPKGAEIEHRNLLNYLRWSARTYFGPDDVAGLLTPLAVDLTLTTLLTPLVAGAAIRVYGDGMTIEEALRTAVDDDGVTLLKLTPSHLRLLVSLPTTAGSLRTLVVGGEDLRRHLAEVTQDRFPSAALYNEYGPTETTVGCMIHRFRGVGRTPSVPLGTAIDNTEIRVVSPWGAATPTGEVGELRVLGDSVGRGYAAAPDLTRQRFAPPVVGTWQRSYRTGDLVRVADAETLLFAGRVDRQVKVRGHRIELDEIEAALRGLPSVDDAAAVVVDSDDDGGRYVVAAVTPESVDPTRLRELLVHRLPPYAVPAAIHPLRTLPLTAHGKVNAAAVRALGTTPGTPPTDDELTARVLAAVASVLGREVDPAADLLGHGLDSIKSVQIAALLQAAGHPVRPRDVLAGGSVRAIALLIAATPQDVSAGPSPGDDADSVPQTPAVAWFVGQRLPVPDGYCQVVVLELKQRFDPARVQGAVQALVARHASLRLSLAPPCEHLRQVSRYDPNLEVVPVEGLGLRVTEVILERLRRRIDLAAGHLLTAALADDGRRQMLALCAHHVAVDVYSWSILLPELDALLAIPAHSPAAPPAVGFGRWARYLHARTVDLPAWHERYWRGVLDVAEPRLGQAVVAATPQSAAIARRIVRLPIPALRTRQAGPARSDGELQSLLLTALAEALEPWASTRHCRIELEGLGRRAWPEQPDVSSTVGWFTCQYPVVLPTGRLPWARRLAEVERGLGGVPAGGVSYGLLSHLAGRLAVDPPVLRFNFLGSGLHLPCRNFAVNTELSGLFRAPENPLDCAVALDLALSDGELEIRVEHDAARVTPHAVDALLERYARSLEALGDHLRETGAGPRVAVVPTAVALDEQDLAELFGPADEETLTPEVAR